MVMRFAKKLALKGIMDKAKELHEKGNTVEQIAEKFWAEPKVAEGLRALSITDAELIKMIKNKVKVK